MADNLTNNLSLILMTTGTASGTWGTVLNASMITIADQALGNSVNVALSSSDVNLSTVQRQNLGFRLTGVLTTAINVNLPLNPNSTTNAVGGYFIFDNQTTGAFGVTVKTIATGSVGVDVPQGVCALLYANGSSNVVYADDTQNRTITYNGNPNGNVAGTAGSASTRASRVIDRSTNEEYLCTTSGTASSTVWSKNLPYSFASQGYLTANSDATSPILTIDSLGATTIYYTAFVGNLMFIYNGVSFVPVTITGGQLSLALSSSFQGANNIYDVLGFLDSGTPRIGFSPAWSNATAGSCSRGSGAGTPQFTRVNGISVNAVQQTVNNGASTYTVAANRGTLLGSVWIDTSAGQVTCNLTYGQSRKYGIWNVYNRLPIILRAGDSTASWVYTTGTWRAARAQSTNSLTVFSGMAEEWFILRYADFVTNADPGDHPPLIGIGVNSTSSPSGLTGKVGGDSGAGVDVGASLIGLYELSPALGIQTITALENGGGGGNTTFFGTSAFMELYANYNG